MRQKWYITLPLLLAATAVTGQERRSSSLYLRPTSKADVTVSFEIGAEGKRFTPTWGLDQAWVSEQNLKKGINHIGKENIGIGRSAFRFTKPLVNDSALATDQINYLRQRSNIFNSVSSTLPIVLTADQEAGADEYYVKNKVANNAHWAAMINSHVHWMQQNTKHPVVGISPFNEGDYWSVEEGATPAKQWQVAKLLKENYPRCADIAMVGGNTLNDDKAWEWFNSGKAYYDWGNTHQLAGSFDNFALFFERLTAAGKIGYADEMHNVGEAMIGLEYGMTVGIWWGFDSRARGEFCDISRNGRRLAYGEHRDNWTAASVYQHDDGRVKAFIGSSERQAATTTYQFVSPDREVYFDGYGPVRNFSMEIPGGTGYQKGQTNAERVIDITWGDDVPPTAIDAGIYKLVNKATENVAAVSGDNIVMQSYTGRKAQQWNVAPVDTRIGGDYSFYEFTAVNNSKTRPNVLNFQTADGTNIMAYSQNDVPSSNEQWYLQYAGNGYYYVRSRETALYMASANSTSSNGVNVLQRKMPTTDTAIERLLWRLLPVDIDYETEAPAQPTGLKAVARTASVALSWTANTEEDLDGYMVLRAPEGSDDWNTIARRISGTSFIDNTVRAGTLYIYKVKAIDRAQNQSEPSVTATAGPTGTTAMVARWQMEESLADETENMMDAAMYGTANYNADCKEGKAALNLRGSASQYVQLPYEVATTDELSFAAWVKVSNSTAWQRIFDFGRDTDHYLFLTPSNGSVMRFAIKNGDAEQTVDCSEKLPLQKWKHVAVSIGHGRTVIYVDGEVAGESTAITISPADVQPVLNYLGRSQFAADPFLTGYMDDVQIYNYALDQEGVRNAMNGMAVGISEVVGANGTNDANGTYGTYRTFSLGGQRVGGTPNKGVYIERNGKKVRKVVR